ncbi:GRP family sugar transporter, partial [Staphylococcus epidermidis]|uniref:GRP family sugar transporter n=1 Tax=Staphylococcus epidermidis TaxID=1282 RepID=UPI001C92D8A3
PILILPLIYPFINMSKADPFKDKLTSQQIISPFFFPFPPLTYLISPQPNINPLPTPFLLSQTSLLLPTLTRIFFLNHKKTSKQL